MLAAAIPALFRWPLVLLPLYGAVALLVIVLLFVEWLSAGLKSGEESGKRGGEFFRGRHR